MDDYTYNASFFILSKNYNIIENKTLEAQIIFEKIIVNATSNSHKSNGTALTIGDVREAIFRLRKVKNKLFEKNKKAFKESKKENTSIFCLHCGNEFKDKKQVICEICGLNID